MNDIDAMPASETLVETFPCSCSCHSIPGVSHIVACCDEPPVAKSTGFGLLSFGKASNSCSIDGVCS